MLELEDLLFRTRALAQAHPFTPAAYRFVTAVVERERRRQPVEEMGVWAGHALTAGYCLRCVEEADDVGWEPPALPAGPEDLGQLADRIAVAIRTDGAESYLCYPPERVVSALDALIAGEVERRLGGLADLVDDETWEELEEYLAWWTIKGYALRVAETVLDHHAGAGTTSSLSAGRQ